ncbi:WecB/TagA/CpsF family glycosyltransferase [Chenggangzhangella methanolivorans]|uniref:WecB/TagA/CpsF family glycosyltransferase n=1 Tax=Chenggangzhangella methanolivorans TaxID=1437009 RepID=UPI003610BF57
MTQQFLCVGGLEIPYVSRARAVAAIDRSLEGAGQIRVAFANANTMLQAMTSTEYARAFNSFLVLNDGVGIDICSRLFNGRRFDENLNGTDFTPALLRESRHDFRIFLLGGKPGVAEDAASKFAEAHPRHKVVGVHNGYFEDADAPDVIARINASKADLVLVALGNPRQEQFVATHARDIEAPVILMVGALFDFVAGRVIRAPRFVRAARAEWMFRLLQEPRRLGRRYTLDVVRFLARLLWMKTSRRRRPSSIKRRLRPEN